jgi:hypothetical protein
MRNSLLWSSFALGLLACSHQSKPQTVSAGPPVTETAGGQKCGVMQTPGTNVVTNDTGDGVAIVFTTTGDVSDLRTQVRQMADQHNGMAGTGPGQDVSPGNPGEAAPGATVGGDMHGGVNGHEATAGADVHGGVKDDDDKHGATVGADLHAGVKDKGVAAGADVHGGVAGHTATAGADVHGGVKDKDDHSGVTAGADVHGATTGKDDTHAVTGADTQGDLSVAMVPSRARTEDVPGGERLVLVPNDPSQLPALREQARAQVSMLEKGECPRG